jgi:hypothetical protein
MTVASETSTPARRHDRLGTGDAIALPATYAEAVRVTR